MENFKKKKNLEEKDTFIVSKFIKKSDSLSPHYLSPRHSPPDHCSLPKPHLTDHHSDRRSSPNSDQPPTSVRLAWIVVRTRRRRARAPDQSRDWLARPSSNPWAASTPASLSSATPPGVLSRPDLHSAKLEPAPVKIRSRHGKSFFKHCRGATAKLLFVVLPSLSSFWAESSSKTSLDAHKSRIVFIKNSTKKPIFARVSFIEVREYH